MRVYGLDEVDAALCLMNLDAFGKRTYSSGKFCLLLLCDPFLLVNWHESRFLVSLYSFNVEKTTQRKKIGSVKKERSAWSLFC